MGLAIGTSFSFPVAFNLTGYVLHGGNNGAPTISPGVQTSVLDLFTINGQTGYSTGVPISLTGKVASANPVISLSPLQVNFPGIVIGSATATAGSTGSLVINNIGQNAMTILGYAFATGSFANNANSTVTNVTTTNGVADLDINGYFTSMDLPPVGTIIQGGSEITVNILFNTTVRTHLFRLFLQSYLHYNRSLEVILVLLLFILMAVPITLF